MSQDQQLISLRNQLLRICPEMQNDIQTIGKQDLKQLISMAMQGQNQNQSKPQKSKRQQMINQLAKLGDVSIAELRNLPESDLEQIYNKYKQIDQANKKKQHDKKVQNRKRKIIQNGQINVYEMKRVLIDKMPEYRNDIRNLTDEQIKKMYRDLQDKNQISDRAARTMNQISSRQQPYPNYGINNQYNSIGNQNIMNSGPSMPKLPYKPPQSRFDQDNDSYYQSQQPQSQFGLRKRGRPRKIRQNTGFSYDDAPNYGGNMHNMKPLNSRMYDYGTDYPASDYGSSVNKFQVQQSNFPISNNIYQPSSYKIPKMPIQKVQSYEIPPTPIDYNGNSIPQVISKPALKQQKNNRKCKITFYLNESDLEDQPNQIEPKEQPKEKSLQQQQKVNDLQIIQSVQKKQDSIKKAKQLKEKRKNKLAKLVETLYEAFGKRSWQIQ